MAKPLARVLTLLDILQTGGTRSMRELAERLGVDHRTVRRYINHLLDLDVPVESVRGRYGGYRLAPGYRMPPLMLTDDEAVAVLLGLTGIRRTALDPDAALALYTPAQTRVIEAALDLFAEHGISGTSLQMIADGLGVTKAAVYHQFPTKDEIVLGSIQDLSGPIAAFGKQTRLGMVLRVVAGQGTAVAFVLVALAFLGLFLLGWRVVARVVSRR